MRGAGTRRLEGADELRRRRAAYEKCARLASERESAGSFDDALFWHCAAATVAWTHPFDKWQDAAMDRSIERIALSLPRGPAPPRPDRLAVITSNIIDGGGHVELLRLWLETVRGFEQSVVSSEWQDSTANGAQTLASLSAHHAVHLCPRQLTPTQKVSWLYERLREIRPAKILLDVFPNDVLSLAAAVMYRAASGAELILYDQGETYFWCGASLVDRVFEWREAGAHIARALRGIDARKIHVVPPASRSRRSAATSRAELGVPAGSTLSLTVGSYAKFRPDGHFDYAATLERVMAEHATHYHLIVGHGQHEDELKSRLRSGRVLWLGRRTDVDALLEISDFVVESFPLMGGMFRFDAIRVGRPVVAASHPAWPLAFDTGALPPGYPFLAESNEQIVEHCRTLIADGDLRSRVGASLRRRYESMFSVENFSAALNGALGGEGHAASLPETAMNYDAERFALLMNPHPLSFREQIGAITELLGYSPPPTVSERLLSLTGRLRESIKYRTGIELP
jgi:glycosyltransferase involved in cell wall biosynthesis